MSGQIIIINGTSGSGKSTTCELFSRRSTEFWMLHGIDHFMGSNFPRQFGHHGERCEEGISAHPLDESEPEGALRWRFGLWGHRGFAAFHESVAAVARQGCNIIIDHLMITDPPILQDCIWRLQDLPVLLVTLKPPYTVLMERVASREIGTRFASSQFDEERIRKSRERLERLRPWLYQAVYANPICDLEIDSDALGPDSVCQQIEHRLKAGPGTAFDQLRQIYPGGVDGFSGFVG